MADRNQSKGKVNSVKGNTGQLNKNQQNAQPRAVTSKATTTRPSRPNTPNPNPNKSRPKTPSPNRTKSTKIQPQPSKTPAADHAHGKKEHRKTRRSSLLPSEGIKHFTHDTRRCCHDDTIEYFDRYSNVEVGSQFDKLFHGERVGFNERKPENYVYIVDLDSFEYHKIGFHTFLGEILQSFLFR